MDAQFGTNATTYYLILPLLVIVIAVIIWFVIKIKTKVWKKAILSILSLFAFFGFITVTLGTYYQFNDQFSFLFRTYAYSILSPDDDPFLQSDGYYGSILITSEVYIQDDQVHLGTPFSYPGEEYGGYIFTPGKWKVVGMTDGVLTVRETNLAGEANIVNTSLWWALTKDPFSYTADASDWDPEAVDNNKTITAVKHITTSPDGKHIIYVEDSSQQPYRSIKYRNIESGTEHILNTTTMKNEYYDFTWHGNSRVYFATYGPIVGDGHSSFHYYDFSGIDPLAETAIVFEDPELLMYRKVSIAGVSEDTLYLQKNNKIYSIDLKQGPGAIPILFEEIK